MAERMIMEEVACLFVEQYEAMFHKDYKVSDVNLRACAEIIHT